MTVLGPVIRFGTKVGIVGGAVYYTNQVGLWGESSQTEVIYKDLYKATVPYIKQTAIEVPELPKMSDASRVLTQSWNRGVITSTEFLMHLPSHVAEWGSSAYKKVSDLVSDPSPPTA